MCLLHKLEPGQNRASLGAEVDFFFNREASTLLSILWDRNPSQSEPSLSDYPSWAMMDKKLESNL